MSEYSGYEKMSSSLKKLKKGNTSMSPDDFAKLDKLKWVVTEKVHGANFSLIYENNTLKYGKRKEYLSWQDDFFGFQLVVNQVEDRVIRLFEELSNQVKGTKYVIYGELFGGKYPHAEVIADEKLHAIQTGVYYSPSIHFCAFDIAVEIDESEGKYYLDYETALAYFEKHQLLHARPLLIGKLNDANDFDTRINSTIPALLNLPELEENLIEGIVIKPYNQMMEDQTGARPIFKVKNKEFEEEKKFHEAQKWSFIPNVSSKTEELSFILDELRNYITPNRLESAISKIGALDFNKPARVDEIATELLRDAIADFDENNDNLLNDLNNSDMAWLEERAQAVIGSLINEKR